MSEAEIVYPDRQDLEWWVTYLQSDTTLKISLPEINDVWYTRMLEMIERVQYSPSPRELHSKGAELFYNTIKAHNFLDGNKRSGILIVYLYYLVNDHIIRARMDVRALAKSVARSKGRTRHDFWMIKLTGRFMQCTERLFDMANTVLKPEE